MHPVQDNFTPNGKYLVQCINILPSLILFTVKNFLYALNIQKSFAANKVNDGKNNYCQ